MTDSPCTLNIWSNYFDIATIALKSEHFETAVTMFAAAVLEAERMDLSTPRQVAGLHGLACAHRRMGARRESEILLRKAFKLVCQSPNIELSDLSQIACLLADCHLENGEGPKAVPVLKMAAACISQAEGAESPALAPLFKRLAFVYSISSRRARADLFLVRALNIETGASRCT